VLSGSGFEVIGDSDVEDTGLAGHDVNVVDHGGIVARTIPLCQGREEKRGPSAASRKRRGSPVGMTGTGGAVRGGDMAGTCDEASRISRTFASVFPRQYSSNSRTYFSCAQRHLQPPQVEASSGSIAKNRRERNRSEDWPLQEQKRKEPV
jgi:hypothetical protein